MSQPILEVETKVDDTTTQPASTEETTEQGVETNPGGEATTTEVTAPTQKTNEIDYEAELTKVTAERDNYKTGMLLAKDELKKKEQTTETETTPSGTETPEFITADDLTKQIESNLRAEFDAKLSQSQLALVSDLIEAQLEELSDNANERALIKFHYENTINRTGVTRQNIAQDLRRAKLLANETALPKENAELKEALKARASVGKPVSGANQSPIEPESEIKLNPQEKALLTRTAASQGLTLKVYLERNKDKFTNQN